MSSRLPAKAPRTVPELFAAQVRATPDAVAVAHDGHTSTYRELDDRAARLAAVLADEGARPGTLVAVLPDRSADLVVALLAVLKTGAGYVPIAADDPAKRIAQVLADSATPIVVASGEAVRTVLAGTATDARVLHLGSPQTERLLDDHDPAGSPYCAHSPAPVPPPAGDDTAYVIYTSGSTGTPKGVVIDHAALNVYLDHVRTHYPATAGRTLLHSSVSFDLAVTSIFPPLLSGGSVEIVDLLALADGRALPPGFRKPTFLKVTPSHLALLRRLPAQCSPSEQLVIGGEALLGTALQEWRTAHPGVGVVNEYGPTEATVGCCVYTVGPGHRLEPGAVPIGRAVEGTRLYVLDGARRPVPDGARGELFIGGAQVARGYLNRPELTAERFLDDPFDGPGTRMYRTGDLVRTRPDGELEYLGRTDDQVKVNGHRVEPGEIEAALAASPLVDRAAVAAGTDTAGTTVLTAYVVTADRTAVDAAELRRSLARTLPPYMVPAVFVAMDDLPLTANGKLDREALPAPGTGRPAATRTAPVTPEQELLCRVIAETVGAQEVGIDDDFLALGGTSIAAARVVTRARKAGLQIPLTAVLRLRTVRDILAAG
ncbi:non-ribosomal peptide synthetase [Kitasatospora sp. NPDC048540]|uniref:non-ribosomal peptide synthetase n=1 Tax=unclassified Kitasatospora TaxID=2633591 RepID=UPI00068CB826|nr:non-ribosomal peptide synthetase [Kitasatospora sp. MBT63]